MLWVTRRRIRVNRTATGWLVRRFIDPEAAFRFIDPADVARAEIEEGAVGFDAPGARYPHMDAAGRCSFEALVDRHRPGDAALRALARVVHDADFPEEPVKHRRPSFAAFDVVSLTSSRAGKLATLSSEAPGLRAISQGFPLVAADDHETLDRAAFLYDALYASFRERLGR